MIRNYSQLVATHGKPARIVLSALNAAISSVDPRLLVTNSVELKGNLIVKSINGESLTLERFRDVYIVGAGKAVGGMAESLYTILGKKVRGGAITVPYGQESKIDRKLKSKIKLTEAGHPMPDAAGVKGTENIIHILGRANKDDLVFVLLSGGGSALLPLPAPGLSLADKQSMTDKLLRSGATISEINVVRKHLSGIKGGRLPGFAKSARIVSVILSDVVGDDLSSIASGPTFADPSTFADAVAILKKYRIDHPESQAIEHLRRGASGAVQDTPKPGDPLFRNVFNFIIGNNRIACQSAVAYLRKHRVKAAYLGSEFTGEARDHGRFLANLASDITAGGKNVGVVLGGETTVSMGSRATGKGGRNTEAALSYLMHTDGGSIVACIGTDGIDGNSDAAGALITRNTLLKARKKGLKLKCYLRMHDSYSALKATDSLILTGLTGTNVNDISIVYRLG